MTAINSIPDLNYITFTGIVRNMQNLATTRYNLYVIKFDVENTISAPAPENSRRKINVLSVEAWGSLAEKIDRSIKNGTPVLIEGSLVSRSYEDRSKGLHYRMIVKASSVENLGVRS